MKKLIALMLFMSSVLSAHGALALGVALPHPKIPFQIHPGAAATGYHFDGIVALSNCSGSIIRFENSQITDQAMILTNGHCFEGGMPPANKFVYNKPSDRRFKVLNDSGDPVGTVNAAGVMYSTMTGTDITLYKLQETYQQIVTKFNSHSFLLASTHPVSGTPIQVISGYWQRGYTCAINGFADILKEANWTMHDSLRYSMPGCNIIGGTSGSPVIQDGTHTVVGVNNTINEDGEKCTMDNPCEVDATGGVHIQQGQGYAQETYQIYTCVDANRNINLAMPGCQLLH